MLTVGVCSQETIFFTAAQCLQRFTKGPYTNEFLARIGNAEDLSANETPSPEKKEELIQKLILGGQELLEGGDLSAILDS